MTKGERIKYLREKRGLSQVALADMIDVSKQTLYKYENDIITNIPSNKIEAIAAATGSTPWFIMGWDNEEENDILVDYCDRDAILIEMYTHLNNAGRERVMQYVADLLDNAKYRR